MEDIDDGMKLGCGHPMGPFKLLDFVGLDTTYFIANIMFDEFRETRFAPPPLLKRMVLAGRLGRKSRLQVTSVKARQHREWRQLSPGRRGTRAGAPTGNPRRRDWSELGRRDRRIRRRSVTMDENPSEQRRSADGRKEKIKLRRNQSILDRFVHIRTLENQELGLWRQVPGLRE